MCLAWDLCCSLSALACALSHTHKAGGFKLRDFLHNVQVSGLPEILIEGPNLLFDCGRTIAVGRARYWLLKSEGKQKQGAKKCAATPCGNMTQGLWTTVSMTNYPSNKRAS